jgi:major membrane immunogen (membrane-anchored lipoprotein)
MMDGGKRMKRLLAVVLSMILVALALTACSPQSSPAIASATPVATASRMYRDGTYEFKSPADGEGYYVKGTLTVSDGKISAAQWTIYDANRTDKVFDKDYETVFAGNDTYIQQCRDNLKGSEGYTQGLIDGQSIDSVDAVSGATWAYHKFSDFVEGALAQAKVK